MKLAVVGMGLVSPAGDTPSQHVFFLRAGLPSPDASPFVVGDTRVPARFVRALGARAEMGLRLARLADHALGDAVAPLGAAISGVTVFLCTSKPRVGITEADLDAVSRAMSARWQGASVERCFFDAGVFVALREAGERVQSGRARVAIVVAVDSWIALDALADLRAFPPSPWSREACVPSEGAAAVALMNPSDARRERLAIVGVIEGASAAVGASRDDNAAPVDGAAMTTALRALDAGDCYHLAVGAHAVDSLRQHEWGLASARAHDRFGRECPFVCLESRIGRIGAASGLASLVYGFALLRHAATENRDAHEHPFVAWAISPDGTRGVARASVRES